MKDSISEMTTSCVVCILLTVPVLHLLDHFILVVIIVAVSALTLSIAAIVSKCLFTVLRNVVKCAAVCTLYLIDKLLNCSHQRLGVLQKAINTKAKRLSPLFLAVTLLCCLFFSCSRNAGKTPHAPSATRVRSLTCCCKV